MDEPAAALDPISTIKIEGLMESLKVKYTIMIVTQNTQAAQVSDFTVFLINDETCSGTLVEMSSTEQFYSNPKNKQPEYCVTGRFG